MNSKRKYTPDTHPVIAIDLDGTIWNEDYPNTGVPFPNAIETINAMVSEGYEIIIWTARDNENLMFCKKELIDIFELNPNVKFNQHSNYFTSIYKISSPKVNASIYLDDKSYNAPDYSTYWSKLREEFI